MTRDEINKAFALLREYYPNARQLKSKTALDAWRLVLEKFPYSAVKAQVVRHAATHRYFPDVYDITGTLEPEPGAFPPQKPESGKDPQTEAAVYARARRNIAQIRKLVGRP